MENIKEKAINAISTLPASSNIDDIMYRLYVIDKIIKGRAAIEQGEFVLIDDLQKEMESW